MANVTATNFSDAVKTQYERRLLTRAIPRMVHGRWARKSTLNGFGSYELRKYSSLSPVTTPLSEGVTPTENPAPSYSSITITPVFYGAFLKYTDMVDMEVFDPLVSEFSAILGEQCGLSADTIWRDAMVTGATIDYAGDATSINSIDFPYHEIKYSDIVKQIAALEAEGALPVEEDYFILILHPHSWASLLQDPTFVNLWVQESGDGSALRTGYMGKLLRCKIYVTGNAYENADAGAGGTTDVYYALFIARDSYGGVGFTGHMPNEVDNQSDNGKPLTGQKIKPVEIIGKPIGSAGSLDPLNQRGTIAWKMALTPAILNPLWIRVLAHANVFSDD